MKVLVTGGAGFVGSHLVGALIEAGHSVAVVDNLSTGRRENVNEPARLYELDIRRMGVHQTPMFEAFAAERPEVVYHLAAQSNYRTGLIDPSGDALANVCGTLHVLEAARAFGVRKFVYASTGGGVYGEPENLPITESHPIRPLSPYGASKYAGEVYVRLYGATWGLGYTVLRLPNVYGPRQNPDGEAGVASIFAGQCLRGLPVTVNGDGQQTRDFVYVGDVVRAFTLALDRGGGETLNVGSGHGARILDLAHLVAWACGVTLDARFGPAVKGEPREIVLDAGRAEGALGWQRRVSLREGIERTVEWVRAELGVTA